jgi:hypothetical protein
MIKRFIYAGAVALALSACQFYDVDEVLLSRSDISLTLKGALQISFDENTYQLGYNTERNEYRVYDEKLENWFILRCSTQPTSEGQELKARLEYTVKGDTKTLNNLELTVERTSSEGLIWLWCKDRKIGAVVKAL